eukprot:TRINITY_DN5279_c0_g2_i1.p1 TRINITY_DN5279_c0_g2~~TRINITY_DN5279_c0_g2_i1.p1  ORF type:complete len:654 (-),score=101.34 TRINITY_DN5279_c0_g2_i1:144-2105(-)
MSEREDISNIRDRISAVQNKKRGSVAADDEEPPSAGAKKEGTFVDAAAMKEKVREKLCKPKYNVFNFYHEYGLFPLIAKNGKFEMITLVVITLNAFWLAVDTDGNKADVLIYAEPRFIVAENAFCFYFSLEWFIRFMSFKRKRDGTKDAWFVFDSVMVLAMVLETWVMSAALLLSPSDSSGGNTGFLRIAKLFRLSRMARMARLMRAMPEMMILIRGMAAAARSVFFTLCLLVVIIYVFAILFVQLTMDTPVGDKYFKDVPSAMFTLLLQGTLLDSVSYIATDFMSEAFYMNVFFFLFVLLASFTLMNMLIGVLCEVVSAVAAVEKEEMLIGYVKEKLERVVEMVDTDGGGSISKKEFMQILGIEEAIRCLQDVGVDAIGLVDFADFIFQDGDGDDDDEDGDSRGLELDFPAFMDVVLQFRGSNVASVKDMVDLRKFVHTEMKKVRQACLGTARLTAMPATQQPLRQTTAAEVKANDVGPRDVASLQGSWEPYSANARSANIPAAKQAKDVCFLRFDPDPDSVDLPPRFSGDIPPRFSITSADLQAPPPRLAHNDLQSIQAVPPASFRDGRVGPEQGEKSLNGSSSVGNAVNGVPPPWMDASMEILWKRVGDRVSMMIDQPDDVNGTSNRRGDTGNSGRQAGEGELPPENGTK